MPPPRVAVILLNWNNYPDSKACLDSLAACGYPDLAVVIVDNHSKDGSGAKLHAEYPQHAYRETAENLGFARGCNVGLRAALEDPATAHALLLNNDAVAAPGFLEPLVAAAADPAVGAVCGKVLMHGNRFWYAGGRIDRLRGGVVARGFGEVDSGQYDRAGDTRFATGGLMLVPRRVLEAVGLLPEEYFFGFEEYDYSLRLRGAGLAIRYEPASVVVHQGDGSHDNLSAKYLYNSYRNKLILQQKYLPLSRLTFPLWRRLFRLYARRNSHRRLERWLADNAFVGRDAPLKASYEFAIDRAVRDHAAGAPLDEGALEAFEREWEAAGAAPPAAG